MSEPCPAPELFFDELSAGRDEALEHAKGCERCAALLEEHRQLEKDLTRLADPLPPADFVQKVMAKVAASPAPVRSEVKVGIAVVVLALASGAVAFFAGDAQLGSFGVALARALVFARELGIALWSGLAVIWSAAAWPMAIAMAAAMLLSVFGLKRFSEARVSR